MGRFGSKIGENMWAHRVLGGQVPGLQAEGLEGVSWVEKWDDALIAGRLMGRKKELLSREVEIKSAIGVETHAQDQGILNVQGPDLDRWKCLV
jgi:hypothetical protein